MAQFFFAFTKWPIHSISAKMQLDAFFGSKFNTGAVSPNTIKVLYCIPGGHFDIFSLFLSNFLIKNLKPKLSSSRKKAAAKEETLNSQFTFSLEIFAIKRT